MVMWWLLPQYPVSRQKGCYCKPRPGSHTRFRGSYTHGTQSGDTQEKAIGHFDYTTLWQLALGHTKRFEIDTSSEDVSFAILFTIHLHKSKACKIQNDSQDSGSMQDADAKRPWLNTSAERVFPVFQSFCSGFGFRSLPIQEPSQTSGCT